MKVFALTFGDVETGSTQYRLAQYREYLECQGVDLQMVSQHDVQDSHLKQMADADVVINQKCLLPLNLAKKIRRASKRLIFDFDDAVYTRPGKPYSLITRWRVRYRLGYWMKNSDLVIAANHHLRIYAETWGARVVVIPMTLDLDLWKPKNRKGDKNSIVVGWAGAPANIHHIERLEPVLKELQAHHPILKLCIYSGKRPSLELPFTHTPFKGGTETTFVQQLDIGLLPLVNDEFSRGKSPIKAIQYLACGVPVVGNVNGASGEILNGNNCIPVTSKREWLEGIEYLIQNPSAAQELGENGRKHIEKYNNFHEVKQQLLGLLQGIRSPHPE